MILSNFMITGKPNDAVNPDKIKKPFVHQTLFTWYEEKESNLLKLNNIY